MTTKVTRQFSFFSFLFLSSPESLRGPNWTPAKILVVHLESEWSMDRDLDQKKRRRPTTNKNCKACLLTAVALLNKVRYSLAMAESQIALLQAVHVCRFFVKWLSAVRVWTENGS